MHSAVTAETVLCWNLHFTFSTLTAGVHRGILYFRRPHQSRVSWSHRHWNQAVSQRCYTEGFFLEFQMNSWHFQLKENNRKQNSIFGLVTMTSSFPCAWAVFAQLLKSMKSISHKYLIPFLLFHKGTFVSSSFWFLITWLLGVPLFFWVKSGIQISDSRRCFIQATQSVSFWPCISGKKCCEFSVK